jgi:DNA replication protein DnaC
MNASTLNEQCKVLKLGTVPRIYVRVAYSNNEQFPTELFAEELKAREENRIRRVLHRAAFPQTKNLDSFEWTGVTLPNKTTQEELANLSFIDKKECLICMGAVGTGKTHLVTALGMRACMAGKEVRFFRTTELAGRLLENHAKGTLGRFMGELEKCDLLILDELGFVPLHRHGAELLFNVVASCYERHSVAVTTNLEFGQWNTVFGDNKLTAALIDRLVHHAHVLAFSGQSYRLRHALSQMAESEAQGV